MEDRTWTMSFKLRDQPNSRFMVEPGRVNYVGDLVARGQSWLRAISIQNSGLAAAELVDREFPGLTDRFAWKYVGVYPDEFVEFSNQRRKQAAQTQVPEPQLPEPSIDARDWSERLFPASENEYIELDPSGRFVFEARTVKGTMSLKMVDLETSLRRSLYLGPESLAGIVYVGKSDVVLNLRANDGAVRSVGLSLENPDQMNPVEFKFGGRIVDMIPGSEREVLVETTSDGLRLYRLDFSRATDEDALDEAEELNRKVKDDAFWWVDPLGVPRLMLFAIQTMKTRIIASFRSLAERFLNSQLFTPARGRDKRRLQARPSPEGRYASPTARRLRGRGGRTAGAGRAAPRTRSAPSADP